MDKPTLIINGTVFTAWVERDSYDTQLSPVYSQKVTTLDKVDHYVKLRNRGSVSFKLNPQKLADSAAAATALLSLPAECRYYCLQRNQLVNATMSTSAPSANYLSRCKAGNADWSQLGKITLTEL